MNKVGLPFLLLFYLYPITPKVLPFLSSRKVMAIFGIFFVITRISNKLYNGNLLIKKELIYIVLSLLLIASLSFITVLYNGTTELQFVSYVISNTIIFVSAYFVIKVINGSGIYVSSEYLIKLIIYSIALQCLISILMHFIPSLKDIILSITAFDDTQLETIDRLEAERVIGFGLTFFWAGAYCGMGLILIAYLIKYSYIQSKQIFWFVLLYAFIFVIGMMMARTTIIGASLSLLLFLFPHKQNAFSYRSVKFIGLLVIFPVLFISTLYLAFPNLFSKIDYLIQFAFEMFINLKNKGELQTDSTDVLKNMFILPDNLKTWIIGDGYWMNPVGEGYYMHTDVGFLRAIYYFGLAGLLSFILSQLIILKYSLNKKLLFITILAYFLILNVKGFFEYTPFFALLIASHYQMKKPQYLKYI